MGNKVIARLHTTTNKELNNQNSDASLFKAKRNSEIETLNVENALVLLAYKSNI